MVVDPEVLRAVLIEYLLRTLWALLALIGTILAARVVRGVAVRALGRQKAHANVTTLVGNLAQLAVFLVGVLVIVAIYTQDAFGWILASLSIVGLVVGLSFQDILRNFFAGVWILIERPFRIGDTIEVAGQAGVVQEISFRTTQLRTDDGREVVVPNAMLMNFAVVNHTRYPARSVRLAVTFPAGEEQGDVAALLRDALAESPVIAADPAPAAVLRGVTDGRARYELTVWGRDREAVLGAAIAGVRARFPQWDVQSA